MAQTQHVVVDIQPQWYIVKAKFSSFKHRLSVTCLQQIYSGGRQLVAKPD